MSQFHVSSPTKARNFDFPLGLLPAIGVFGLVFDLIVLLLDNPISTRLVWLAENYPNHTSPLDGQRIQDVNNGVRLWGWCGIVVGIVALISSWELVRFRVLAAWAWLSRKTNHPLPLPPDRFGWGFFFPAALVLIFTTLTHWSLTAYKDVDWFGGEDGASEWWSVATYLVGATLATVTSWRLRQAKHTRLASINLCLAAVFLLGTLEEISWGQRLFNWSTPEALDAVNQQGETTIHNVGSLASVIFAVLFWGSVLALAGGVIRTGSHLAKRVTSVDFLLPSLVMAPALLMILVWRIGAFWTPVNLPRLVMEAFEFGPQDSEVPEVLLGLCICIYTYGNLRQLTATYGGPECC